MKGPSLDVISRNINAVKILVTGHNVTSTHFFTFLHILQLNT